MFPSREILAETSATFGETAFMLRRVASIKTFSAFCGSAFALGLSLLAAHAATTGRGYDMDYGPFFDYTIQTKNETVSKGVTVKVSDGVNTGAILFDTETFRYAAGWTGGWLDLSTTHLASYKGLIAPRVAGKIQFTTAPGPGWAKNGSFVDPRVDSVGPLPHDWAKYHGFYRHGSNVVFSYNVGGVEVLDSPGLSERNGQPVFTRTLNTTGLLAAPVENLATLREDLSPLCHGGPLLWPQTLTTTCTRGGDDAPFVVDTITLPENNPWRSWMRLSALDFFSDGRAAVTTWNGDVWIVSGLDDSLKNVKWKRFASGLFDPLGIKIVHDQIYVMERSQITHLVDLNNDGEADFYECFNNDGGVAPIYHAFAMDLQTDSAGNFYYTRAGLTIPPKYPLNGGMIRVSADGAHAELIAHGLRAANGMSIGPHDEITCSDNQGNWVPSSRINLITPGGFYGYVPHAHTAAKPLATDAPLCWIPMALDNSSGGQVWMTSAAWPRVLTNHLLHTSYGKAALFDVLWETIPAEKDLAKVQSPKSKANAESSNASSTLDLRHGTLDNPVAQGGIVKFPLKFASGIQRARFNPRDGQLYVVGLKGWQTDGVKDGCFQRVRATGRPLNMPVGLHVKAGGIEIIFSDALDKTSAEDLQNYSLEQWNYRWTEKYGSDDYSVADPKKKGRDAVNVRSAKLSADQKHLFLGIADLKPVMQMKIKFAVKSSDDAPVEWEIYNTINRVPAQP